MSLNLIKNDKTKAFNNLFIKEYYIALSIEYLNNDICLNKNLRWRYIRTIVSAMTMLSAKFTFFFYLLVHFPLRPSQ